MYCLSLLSSLCVGISETVAFNCTSSSIASSFVNFFTTFTELSLYVEESVKEPLKFGSFTESSESSSNSSLLQFSSFSLDLRKRNRIPFSLSLCSKHVFQEKLCGSVMLLSFFSWIWTLQTLKFSRLNQKGRHYNFSVDFDRYYVQHFRCLRLN